MQMNRCRRIENSINDVKIRKCVPFLRLQSGSNLCPVQVIVSRTCCETRCCMRDDGRSIGAALWEEASNCRKRLRSKGGVVNVSVKRRNKYVKYGLESRAQAN